MEYGFHNLILAINNFQNKRQKMSRTKQSLEENIELIVQNILKQKLQFYEL